MDFSVKAFAKHKLSFKKITKGFMCLKSVLIPVYIAKSGRQSFLCAYFFSSKACVLIFEH